MTLDGGGWARVVENASYTGVNSNNNYYVLVGGTYGEIRATWRSGFVSCNSGSTFPGSGAYGQASPWQACHATHGADIFSFELMKDGALFLGAAGDAWNALPAECALPTSTTASILCAKSITFTREVTTLQPTWVENRLNTSTSDNIGTIFVDLWVR